MAKFTRMMFEKYVNFSASYFSSGANAFKTISEDALISCELEKLEWSDPSKLLHKMKTHNDSMVSLTFISLIKKDGVYEDNYNPDLNVVDRC